MGWTTDVLEGLAQHLAANIDGAAFRPDGPAYTTTEIGIVIGRVPAAPDRVIVLNTYPVRSGALSDITLGLQVRVRGPKTADPRPVQDLTDAVYELLHGANQLTLGPALCALVWRQSWAWLGADDNGREETTSNFYAETAQASAHVTD